MEQEGGVNESICMTTGKLQLAPGGKGCGMLDNFRMEREPSEMVVVVWDPSACVNMQFTLSALSDPHSLC